MKKLAKSESFSSVCLNSSCLSTVQIGRKVKKGDQLGYFMFGGSSHVLIFEKKAKLKFKEHAFYKVNNETKKN